MNEDILSSLPDHLRDEVISVLDRSEEKDVSKEWVKDPSPNAQQTRWRNTETNEYRYQESEPGSGHSGGGGGGGGDVDVSEVDTEYDIDSNFGADVAQAMEENDGDPVGTIRANEWMSNAGKIDDPDLLLDALDPIQDHGTKTARDRVRRRLRGMGWEPDEIDDAVETDDPDPVDHDEFREQYSPFEVADQTSLADAGESMGVNAGMMEVHQLEDGTEVYFMEGHPGKHDPIERQMSTYEATRLMGGDVPPHDFGKFSNGNPWYAAREADGEELWSAPDSWKEHVDDDYALDQFAIQLIAGNSDTHGQNVFVDEDGELSFIDLDHSAGRLDEDPSNWGETVWQRGRGEARSSVMKLIDEDDPDTVKQELEDRAREKATEVIEDGRLDDIVESVSQHNEEMAENIRYNIELLASGDDIV
jgi:hypothetical protein